MVETGWGYGAAGQGRPEMASHRLKPEARAWFCRCLDFGLPAPGTMRTNICGFSPAILSLFVWTALGDEHGSLLFAAVLPTDPSAFRLRAPAWDLSVSEGEGEELLLHPSAGDRTRGSPPC